MVRGEKKLKLPALFLVGSGRSGTTLLASILNASEQIYIPYESDFIARAYSYYQYKARFTDNDYRQISKIFQLTAKQVGWGMSEEYVYSQLKEFSPQSFSEVNGVICQAFHQQEKTEHLLWGIKAPVLIASLNRIDRVCPQAKIVNLVRDGRDVYLSYKKIHETSTIKFGPKGVVENALYWVDGLRRVEEFLASNPEHPICELKYEDILNDTVPVLKRLCQFLKIEYQPSMHENFGDLERNNKVTPDRFRKSIHQKLNDKIDIQNTKKYLSAMTKLEQIQFELIAIPYLLKYGYQPQYPILNTVLLAPLRFFLYFFARRFNDWRYNKRDRKIYKQARNKLSKEVTQFSKLYSQ